MSLVLAAIEPKIEQLLALLDRIAAASERSADALETLATAQTDQAGAATTDDAGGNGNAPEPDMDLGRLDGIG